jgi:citrate lyase beta subunit
MIDSYFFIPGDKKKFINGMYELNADFFVVDLEDSVSKNNKKTALKEVINLEVKGNTFVRIPFFDECYSRKELKKLVKHFEGRIVIPKLKNKADLEKVITLISDNYLYKIIILVENTTCFIHLKDILSEFTKHIYGVGFGSHDFMAEIGGVHDLKNLEYARQHILYLARMSNINAIDIASMELNNRSSLEQEILDGVQKGYDAKFFIHPWQIEVFKSLNIYSPEDYNWAVKVQNAFEKAGSAEEFNPVIIEGQVVERPHLNKAKKIIQYYESK